MALFALRPDSGAAGRISAVKRRRSGVVTVAGSGASSLLRRGRSAGARAAARCRCPRTPPTPGTVRTGSSPAGAAARPSVSARRRASARRAWMSARVSLCREAIDIGWVWYGRLSHWASARSSGRRSARPLRMICWLLSRQYSTPGPGVLRQFAALLAIGVGGEHHPRSPSSAITTIRVDGRPCPSTVARPVPAARAVAAGAFQPVAQHLHGVRRRRLELRERGFDGPGEGLGNVRVDAHHGVPPFCPFTGRPGLRRRPRRYTSTAETRSPAPSARAYMRDGRPISTPWRISICCP